jgi:non-heme chloroperoxidase
MAWIHRAALVLLALSPTVGGAQGAYGLRQRAYPRSERSTALSADTTPMSRTVRSDSSAHSLRFVTVAPGVRLEVLDWGGTGRPVVLLSGLGDNAHVYDQFAPKLVGRYHVYAITRRGFAPSSIPGNGYLADSLADDVLAVIDSLGLGRPVLAGHSMGGEELSSIGSRHADKVAGLIYLDAGYDYAFYDQSHGSLTIDINEIIRQLGKLRFGSGTSTQERRRLMAALVDTTLPAFIEWGHALLKEPPEPAGPGPRPLPPVPYAMVSGQQKFTTIHGPVLAIFVTSRPMTPGVVKDSVMLAIAADADAATEGQARAFERGVPQARVVRIPNADHYVFKSNPIEVLNEMRAFIDRLSMSPR